MNHVERICIAILLLTVIGVSTNCRQTSQGKLDGDVFIVTQGAQSVKLGLVEVRILPYAATNNSIAKTRSQAESEIAKLQPRLEAARRVLDAARAKSKATGAEWESKMKLATQTTDLESDIAAMKVADEAHGTYLASLHELESSEDAVAQLEKEVNAWNSGALYFATLPSPLVSVKTDADGKFSIPLNRKVPVVVAAHSTRSVGDKLESYYWLITVSLGGQLNKRLFLSNDNLATTDSADSLIHVVE